MNDCMKKELSEDSSFDTHGFDFFSLSDYFS